MPLTADSVQLGPWKGVRYDIPIEDCAPDELSGMQNTRVGQGGELQQRPGTASYGSEAALAGTPTIVMAAQFNSDANTSHIVIVAGTAIYKYDSGWSAITGAVTVTAADDNTFEWVNANGTLVATNGVDTDAWKWTGTGNAAALDDNARFSKGKHIAWFDNRLWIGNVNGATNQVWYSDIAAIETWGATSFFNFGGIVTGLVPTQNALTVHTTDGIYTLQSTGDATTPYRPNKRTAKAGVDGRSCIALPGDVQLMILDDGIYEWSGGAELEKVSGPLDIGYWDILNSDRLSKAFGLYHPTENEVWFALPYGSGQTAMNHIMVWNRKKRAWYGPYEGWTRACAALISRKPHLGGLDGILWDHEPTDNDDAGTSIDAWAETAAPSPLGADVRVRWLGGRFYYDAKGDYDLSVQQTGADVVGSANSLNLTGNTLVLPGDLPEFISDDTQFSQDLELFGYSAQTAIRFSMNAPSQTWTMRKAFLRYKPLGRFNKPQPTT